MGATLEADIHALASRAFDGEAVTPPELRRACAERARFLAGLGPAGRELPAEWVSYVDKVALHAYKVTDEDVEGLKRAGHSEDEIFEVTMATALGAGVVRAEAGFRALRGKGR